MKNLSETLNEAIGKEIKFSDRSDTRTVYSGKLISVGRDYFVHLVDGDMDGETIIPFSAVLWIQILK